MKKIFKEIKIIEQNNITVIFYVILYDLKMIDILYQYVDNLKINIDKSIEFECKYNYKIMDYIFDVDELNEMFTKIVV
uniref:Uncharacterized protein n=1 Tax=viral metagenome TaxID=1070528 RepID=A0A6C0H4Q1_9ZZZZ